MNPIQPRIKLTQPPEFPRPWRAERVRNTVMVWVLAADGTPVCAVPCMETALIIARAPEALDALRALLDAPTPCDCGVQGCGNEGCPEDQRVAAVSRANNALHRV